MSYKDEYADLIEGQFFDLENRIMADIVRRIKKTGDITSTADYQIERLYDMFGFSSEEIEASIKEALNASYPEMFELYDRVVDEEYTRNKDIYEQINGSFVPYEQNGQLQQWIEAAKRQTKEELKNITATMGFVSNINGQMTFLPLTDFYKKTMDAAMLDITSGAFDYNSTLKRTVREMTNSGVRWIEYESGWHNRITVAARRAVMTGVSQLTGKINEMNAEKLGTEYFEIDWHAGARPSHAEWQGKVWSKKELVTVCGLGTVTGLNGANCYHTYYPFIPGISQRNYTDEWLEEQNRLENIPKTFKGKKYTAYEATQKQRQMETAMRAQREKIRHLEDGGVEPDELILQKCRYQGQLQEYSAFSKAMGLRQQRNRIYIDGLGNVVYGKRKSRVNMLTGGKTTKISARLTTNDIVSNLKKPELQKSKATAVNYMKSELGIKTVTSKELSLEHLNKINEALYNIYMDYPELKGIVQKIGIVDRDEAVAAFCLHNNKGNISTSLLFNITDLNNIDSIIAEAVDKGRWTPKDGLEGVIRHEMAHALEAQRAFETVDIFSNDVNSRIDRYECAMQHKRGFYAEQTVRKAFANLGIEVTEDSIKKYTSGYATAHFKETGKLNEVFAEILSDERKGELYQEIVKVIKER